MHISNTLALVLDPTTILKAAGIEPDPWQRDLLLADDRNGRMFPTCSEILEVVRKLGYEKPL